MYYLYLTVAVSLVIALFVKWRCHLEAPSLDVLSICVVLSAVLPPATGHYLMVTGLHAPLCNVVFVDTLLLVSSFVTALGLLIALYKVWQESRMDGISLCLFLLLLGLLAGQFVMMWVPAIGWDALSHWYFHALEIHDHCEAYPDSRFSMSHRHPNTFRFYFWAVSDLVASRDYLSTALMVRMPYYGALSCLFAAGLYQKMNANMIIILGIAFLSIPLMENHVLLHGYLELYIATCLFVAVFFLTLYQKNKDIKFFLMSTLSAWMMLYIKNTGPFYFLCWLIAVVIIFSVHDKKVRYIFPMAIIVSVSLAGALYNYASPSFSFTGNVAEITFFGRTTELSSASALRIIFNELYSKFLNQSYSICFLIAIIFCIKSFFSRDVITPMARTPLIVLLAGWAGLVLTQITEYGFNFATPLHDTGNSRFALPFAPCILISVFWCHMKFHEPKKPLI